MDTQTQMKKARAARGIQRSLPDMPEDRLQAVQSRLHTMQRTWRNNYIQAVRGKSLRAAIKAMCGECMCWNRAEITDCTALACPLYSQRPFQNKELEDVEYEN